MVRASARPVASPRPARSAAQLSARSARAASAEASARPASGDAGQEVAQNGDGWPHIASPITAVGSQVASPGKTVRITIASTMQSTKGSDPVRMVRSEMSGAMPLMT